VVSSWAISTSNIILDGKTRIKSFQGKLQLCHTDPQPWVNSQKKLDRKLIKQNCLATYLIITKIMAPGVQDYPLKTHLRHILKIRGQGQNVRGLI